MISDRKRKANARNSAKSTGPRTVEGKATSSQNARRHGLCIQPSEDLIMECLRTILDCARVDLADLDLEDAPMLRIALSLARAEARLASVRDAEETFLKDYAEGADLSPYLKKVRTITVQKTVVSRRGQCSYEETETVIEKWTPVERRLALLGRYRAEAESRRSKALQRWLEVAEWDA